MLLLKENICSHEANVFWHFIGSHSPSIFSSDIEIEDANSETVNDFCTFKYYVDHFGVTKINKQHKN